jgi:hypothetical protein
MMRAGSRIQIVGKFMSLPPCYPIIGFGAPPPGQANQGMKVTAMALEMLKDELQGPPGSRYHDCM